jgi:hypothetical protein
LYLFFISVSINEKLMATSTIDIDNLQESLEVMKQMTYLFLTLSIFGCMCFFAIIFHDIKIRQLIKKYNLDVIK